MIWKRALLLVVLTITGLAVETTILGRATLTGTKPELLLLMTVALAMGEGPAFGAVAGFFMGMATDAVLQLPAGVSALTLTLTGYVVGRIRAQLQHPSAFTPMLMISVATFAGVVFYGGFNFVLGEESLSLARIARHAALAAAYNALLTPFVFPVVRGLAARLRPVGVHQ